MSVDREYKIRVSTVTDGNAPQQAAQGLKDVGKATEDAGQHAHMFNTKGREMHELMHKLNELAPGLGQALKVALHPESIGIVGIVIAVELLVKLFEHLKKQAEEFKAIMAKDVDLSGITNSVETIRSAMVDANLKAKEFLHSIDEVAEHMNTVAEASAKITGNMEAEAKAAEAVAKARKAVTLDELEILKEKNQISSEQYDIAKARIESKSAREAAEREVDLINKEKEQVQKDHDTAHQNVESLKKEEQSAEERVAAADNNLKTATQRHDHAKEEFKQEVDLINGTDKEPGLQQQKDEAREKLNSRFEGMSDPELKAQYAKLKGAGENVSGPEAGDRLELKQYLEIEDKLANARRRESGFAAKMQSSETEIAAAKGEKSAADTALADLNKHLKENADAVKSLQDKIDELNRKLTEHGRDAEVYSAQDQKAAIDAVLTRMKGGATTDSIFGAGVQGQQTIQALRDRGFTEEKIDREGEAAKRKRDLGRQPLTPWDQQAIQREDTLQHARNQIKASEDLLNAMGYNAAQIQASFAHMIAIHRSSAEIQKGVQNELAAIHTRMREIEAQISHPRQ